MTPPGSVDDFARPGKEGEEAALSAVASRRGAGVLPAPGALPQQLAQPQQLSSRGTPAQAGGPQFQPPGASAGGGAAEGTARGAAPGSTADAEMQRGLGISGGTGAMSGPGGAMKPGAPGLRFVQKSAEGGLESMPQGQIYNGQGAAGAGTAQRSGGGQGQPNWLFSGGNEGMYHGAQAEGARGMPHPEMRPDEKSRFLSRLQAVQGTGSGMGGMVSGSGLGIAGMHGPPGASPGQQPVGPPPPPQQQLQPQQQQQQQQQQAPHQTQHLLGPQLGRTGPMPEQGKSLQGPEHGQDGRGGLGTRLGELSRCVGPSILLHVSPPPSHCVQSGFRADSHAMLRA
eukprot:gene26326-32286_t